MLRVRNIKGFNLVPYLLKLLMCLPNYFQFTDLLVSLSIISAASPSAAHSKIVYLYGPYSTDVCHHACTEDGYMQCPHPPIIDGDNQVCTPADGGRHHPTAAMVPHPRRRGIQQSADVL